MPLSNRRVISSVFIEALVIEPPNRQSFSTSLAHRSIFTSIALGAA